MIEDEALNRCVKAALEAGGPFGFRRSRARRRRLFWRWAVPTLAAASLAVALALRVTMSVEPDPLADAIALLSEADGVDVEPVENTSSAELLLAWQDAPCRGWL